MKMYVPDINEIWDEILSEKMIKKNRQYGNSVYDEDTIFSGIGDPEELIKIRLDDKMRRLKTLDPASSKYDSELMEIVAYLMHLLNWRRNSGKYEEEEEEIKHINCRCEPITLATGYRQPRDTEQSTEDTRESLKRRIQEFNLW